jgi:hypothetical protein
VAIILVKIAVVLAIVVAIVIWVGILFHDASSFVIRKSLQEQEKGQASGTEANPLS